MSDTLAQKGCHSLFFIYYLIFTALLCGAIIMVIEVLGSRVIGPFFGVSLFVWTSLITVTLVALAAGYAVGGMFSDRRESPDYLYGIILAAGFLVLLIPVFKGMVLKASVPLGLRMGALVSSTLLFGPSLFMLGCVSPYVIKIAAQEMRNIGRTVGLFYAISTIGSFIGTICTGFILIAYFKVNQIFIVVGIMLIVLALIYLALIRRKWYLLLTLIIPFLLPIAEGTKSKVMANGTKVTRVFSKDSFYGNLKVVDYSYGANHTRELIIDGLVQGGIDMNNKMSIYEYFYLLEILPYTLNPGGERCLVVGLGAGIIPMWYEKMGIKTDVLDIDPDVVTTARDYFGFNISGDVIISDARYHLNTSDRQYDYIVLDVFNGDTTPGHILSKEALKIIRSRMTEKGVLAVNMVGSLKKETFMTASIIKTLKEVFATVEIHPAFVVENSDGVGNLAVIAYNFPAANINPEAAKKFTVHPWATSVTQLLDKTFSFPEDTQAIILSDDYNPIDFYDRWMKEQVRKTIIETTDWDMLI